MRIDRITVGDRSRRAMTKIEQLAASIERVGLIQPPVVREVNGGIHLVAGGRRLAALRHLGRTETPVVFARDLDDELTALLAEGEENTEREPFTVVEAVEHRRRIHAVEAGLAKGRQREAGPASVVKRTTHGSSKLDEPSIDQQRAATPDPAAAVPTLVGTGAGPGATSQVSGPAPQERPHERATRHRTAKATGSGATTLDKAEQIIAAAEDPQAPEPVREVARASVTKLAGHGAKVDREFRALAAERAKHNPDLAHAEWRRNFYRVLQPATGLPKYDPATVVAHGDEVMFDLLDSYVRGVVAWHQQVTDQRRSGLRAINGGRA